MIYRNFHWNCYLTGNVMKKIFILFTIYDLACSLPEQNSFFNLVPNHQTDKGRGFYILNYLEGQLD